MWGRSGAGEGQFDGPMGLDVAADGTVCVADNRNDRVQVFTRTGAYLGTWGGHGSGERQFDMPNGVGIARNGTVYIADSENNRIVYYH